ncbi:MAG: OmpA family protein [Rhodospirillales bacterium]|nr:OmpA family protein [Rhodospirillales bacterium]
MTPFRFLAFLILFGLSLPGIGHFGMAYAQSERRPEIEVNTTVLGELEDYQPPPLFDTPDRPVLSRPIEKLALPYIPSDAKKDTFFKKNKENKELKLSHPIIESAPRMAQTPPEKTPDAPLPKTKPGDRLENKKNPPVPSAKPESVKTIAGSASGSTKMPPTLPSTAKPQKNERNFMPALPAESVSKEVLAGSTPPVPEEEILHAPEKKFASYGNTLPDMAPGSGQMDITEYDDSKGKKAPVSADISAASAMSRPKPAIPVAAQPPRVEKHSAKPEIFNRESLVFKKGQADLEAVQADRLKKAIASSLEKNKDARLQIQSFASPADDSQSSARRVSLLRALAVRAYLVSHGIAPSRIDVRALGEDGKGTPADRIDMIVFDPTNTP